MVAVVKGKGRTSAAKPFIPTHAENDTLES